MDIEKNNNIKDDEENVDAILKTSELEILEELEYLGGYQEFVREQNNSFDEN